MKHKNTIPDGTDHEASDSDGEFSTDINNTPQPFTQLI